MRHAILATLMLATGLSLPLIQHEPQTFTPIVRVRSTEGLYITLVQSRADKRGACNARVGSFIDALGDSCPTCTIETSECATKLEGMDMALAEGKRLPIFTVSAGELRVGLLGPPHTVRAECEVMATQFVLSGLKTATCVAPSFETTTVAAESPNFPEPAVTKTVR
jgi:hypothetical protein